MSYQLSERNSTTLEEMQRDAISVEADLLAKRARMRSERRVTIRDEPTTSLANAKIDALTRIVERMMERITLDERTAPRENQLAPQNRNQNPRRNPPQIR